MSAPPDKPRPAVLGPARQGPTFGTQLGIAAVVSMLVVALIASVASSLRGGEQLGSTLQRQGEGMVRSLAAQSRFALLSEAPENVEAAIEAALRFPDVVAVQVFDARGELLIGRNRGDGAFSVPATPPVLPSDDGVIEREADDSWTFASRVAIGQAEPSPFSLEEPAPQDLGTVRLVISKGSLNTLRHDLFLSNLGTSLLFASVVAFLIALLARRMLRPVRDLSSAMGRAMAGERGVRASLDGPRDIAVAAGFALFPITLGMMLYVIGSAMIPATLAALIQTLEAPFGIFWAWVGVGEVPTAETIIGACLVLAAVFGRLLVDARETRAA